MAKYSTGESNKPDPDGDDASCTMCGSTESLKLGEIEGTDVIICRECENSSDNRKESDNKNNNKNNKNNNSDEEENDRGDGQTGGSRGYTITNPDSSWVDDKPNYGNVSTPYLINGYADVVSEAIDKNDITIEEVSDETKISEDKIRSVLNGEALSHNISREDINRLEDYLEIQISEEY